MRAKYKICIGHYSVENDISGVTTWLRNFILDMSAIDSIDLHVLLIDYSPQHQTEIKRLLDENNIAYSTIESAEYTVDMVKGILKYFQNNHFNLFIPHCIEAMYYAAISMEHQGLPFVFTMHSDDPVYWANAQILNNYSNPITVSVSKYIACSYYQKFNSDSYIIPYSFKLNNVNNKNYLPNRFNNILYIGRVVEEQKRISLVFHTMEELCRVNKNVCCTIVGAGPDEEWLLKKLINSEYNNRIKYLGRVRPDCIGEVIKEFGIQLLMSDYEGLPVSMLECMSVGIIPATRNIKSGINELIEDGINGIVLPDNPVNAAEKLNLLIQDDNFLNSASNKCIDISKEFSQEKNIEKWLEVIAQHSAEKPVEINLPKRLIMPKFDKRLQGRYKQKPNLFQILSNKLFKQRL